MSVQFGLKELSHHPRNRHYSIRGLFGKGSPKSYSKGLRDEFFCRFEVYRTAIKHKLFCKRAGIEPTIGHLKSDHCLGRNFYKGVVGDAVNLLLVAAAYNFKRAMRALLNLLKIISEMLSERASTNGFSLSRAF